jgi:asparaginyl-tRNA synthetase
LTKTPADCHALAHTNSAQKAESIVSEHVAIERLSEHVGQNVLLKGWLYASRSSGKLIFLQLRDGTGFAQCVIFKQDVSPELFELAKHLPQETSLTITGTVREHERQKGVFEVGVTGLEVIAKPSAEFPITPKDHGVDFLMDHRHLWLRSKRQHAILRIRAEIVGAIRDYFDSHGFLLVDAPVFTPNACEGTSTLFETDFHGTPAYLTQSGKVYCFGPTFRAEKSKTRRHLAEFWMVEPEVAFMDLEADADLAEDFLVSIVSRVLDRRVEELKVLERDTTVLQRVQKPFPRIRYEEAIRILAEAGNPAKYGDDFGGDEETVISSKFDRPLIVTHYPISLKAFYFKRDPANLELALNMDVLAPEGYGEIIGGGQREDDLAQLEAAIAAHKLPAEAFGWYTDLRRYGTFPHAGFGLGLERTVAWLCGLHHVRETAPFPRMLTRLAP